MKNTFVHFLGALIFIATIALFGLAVMFLWNILLPGIFGLPLINYWQAAGLLVLARILFGGIGWGMMQPPGRQRGRSNPIREMFLHMSEDERAAFIKKRSFGRNHMDHIHEFFENTGEKPPEPSAERQSREGSPPEPETK
jgi:hypothetical protein